MSAGLFLLYTDMQFRNPQQQARAIALTQLLKEVVIPFFAPYLVEHVEKFL